MTMMTILRMYLVWKTISGAYPHESKWPDECSWSVSILIADLRGFRAGYDHDLTLIVIVTMFLLDFGSKSNRKGDEIERTTSAFSVCLMSMTEKSAWLARLHERRERNEPSDCSTNGRMTKACWIESISTHAIFHLLHSVMINSNRKWIYYRLCDCEVIYMSEFNPVFKCSMHE